MLLRLMLGLSLIAGFVGVTVAQVQCAGEKQEFFEEDYEGLFAHNEEKEEES